MHHNSQGSFKNMGLCILLKEIVERGILVLMNRVFSCIMLNCEFSFRPSHISVFSNWEFVQQQVTNWFIGLGATN